MMTLNPDEPSIDQIIETYKTTDTSNKSQKSSIVDRCVDYVKTSIKGSTKMNKGFVYALGASIAAIMVTSYIANHIGMDPKTSRETSYWAESMVGSIVFVCDYSYNRFKQDADWKQIFKELLRIGITGFSISYPLYKPARAGLSGIIEGIGVGADYSATISQVVLLAPFLIVMDLLAKPMKYLIDTGRDFTDRMITATKDYMNNGNGKMHKKD